MSDATPRLIDGPVTASAQAPATLLLAHGAGAPMDSPFMTAIAAGLAERGWRVVRFEFPYMAHMRLTGQRRAPDRLPKLLEAFRQEVALQAEATPGQPLFIGGKSMGGRLASLLADQLAAVSGCLCLGYPFHPPGKPAQLRTEHLEELRTPSLILQGERDSFGRRGEVEGYSLSPAITLQWIAAGDHSFKPTRSSGHTEAGNWQAAVHACDQFMRGQLGSQGGPGHAGST
jgi:predicted alpha/beta-hydrolase family hydrolase